MNDTFYAILVTNYLDNNNVYLNSCIFQSKENAEKCVNEMVNRYIADENFMEKNSNKHYQFHSNTVFAGPSENCLFAEISYKIIEVKLSND